MAVNKVLFYFALVLLIVSIGVFTVNIFKVLRITGYAVGTLNLTVLNLTSINFTTNNINWGSGSVLVGFTNATLDTSRQDATNVSYGNWTSSTAGLVIANIGNVNVTLDVAAGKSPAVMIGGSAITPDYEWNFTNWEANSCKNSTGGTGVIGGNLASTYWDTNSTVKLCSVFEFVDARDTIRIDIRLMIPSDSKTGPMSDIITATATAI